MKRVSALMLGVMVFGLAGFAPAADADDYAKTIVGKWEITKAGGGAPVGTVVEFTKDGKLAVVVKLDDKEQKLDGTYKLDKEKLTVKLTAGGETIDETVTIKKLAGDDMEWEDKDKKVDVLKKKK
jgi:uncharacterized protein (TIGR03066 family)